MRNLFLIFALCSSCAFAQIEQIWITHSKNTPDSVVISWYSANAGSSLVRYGTDKSIKEVVSIKNETPVNLHHVEIPIEKKDCVYFYQVETDGKKSAINSFKGYPSKSRQLRVAVIGNLGYYNPTKNFNALANVKKFSDPHLILTCGDNIPALHLFRNNSAPVALDDILAFRQMVDKAPQLFASTIVMPILGNHDKEFRGRFKKRPNLPHCVYDVDATAYRKFFDLPNEEWYWTLSIPQADLKIAALDLCHLRDFGTGHQACHPFDDNSEQFKWYKKLLSQNKSKYFLTLYNSDNPTTRTIFGGLWGPLFQKGSLVISGYGYFMEHAKLKNGFSYLNTSLNHGDPWFDKSNSVLSKQISGYVLLNFNPSSEPEVSLLDAKTGKPLTSFSMPPAVK